jgi:hypothetical protein
VTFDDVAGADGSKAQLILVDADDDVGTRGHRMHDDVLSPWNLFQDGGDLTPFGRQHVEIGTEEVDHHR